MIGVFLAGFFVGMIVTVAFLYWAERYAAKHLSKSTGFGGQAYGGVGFQGDISAKVTKAKAI